MSEVSVTQLKDVLKQHNAMVKYRDSVYKNLAMQANTKCREILCDDMGAQFVRNCARDFAGEIVRRWFNTSAYYITADQMLLRIRDFSYENEYDPLAENAAFRADVYNYRTVDFKKYLEQADQYQDKLFIKESRTDANGKEHRQYVDQTLIAKGKRDYVNSRMKADGTIIDEYTGRAGEYVTDKNGNHIRRQEVDHVQAAANATFHSRYMDEKGVQALKVFFNSEDNFAMMDKTANTSKGDVKVIVDGKDITHRATPEQLTEAVCHRWEGTKNSNTRQELIHKGYLNEDGKVPASVRHKLTENYRISQNAESVTILQNVQYGLVARDAAAKTAHSFGKIVAGQFIYYAAPAMIYEVRTMVADKSTTLDNVLGRLGDAGKRVYRYVVSKLETIFRNIAFNSIKELLKGFMDILISLVKATVQRLLKIAKTVLLSTVDSVRIIADKNRTNAEKSDAVFTLFGITITNIVIEVLFEIIERGAHIPEPLLSPLQMICSILCTNLTMLILQKADLFDVRFGFKMRSIEQVFAQASSAYDAEIQMVHQYNSEQEALLMAQIKNECNNIYHNLQSLDPKKDSVRGELEKINQIFSININFEDEWLKFLGMGL